MEQGRKMTGAQIQKELEAIRAFYSKKPEREWYRTNPCPCGGGGLLHDSGCMLAGVKEDDALYEPVRWASRDRRI